MKRTLAVATACGIAILSARLALLAREVRNESLLDQARPADLILVMGAAEYRGRPSPILKARLDHALGLYHRGLAPLIMTTGGAGGDPDFTEGEVGRTYLIRHGVPSEAIVVEPEGPSTAYTIAAAAEIMRRMDLASCILVSDGYHMFRTRRMLEFRGVKVFGSPRPEPRRTAAMQWWLCLRQAVGYQLWTVGITF